MTIIKWYEYTQRSTDPSNLTKNKIFDQLKLIGDNILWINVPKNLWNSLDTWY